MKYSYRNLGFKILILFGVLYSCTKGDLPSLTTSPVSDITGSTAFCGGTITDEGSSPVTRRGICWSENIIPTISDNKKNSDGINSTFNCKMSNLKSATSYYVRAFATNKDGTGYGNEISFKTGPAEPYFSEWVSYGNLTDQDGNVYKTVKIGEQTWMAENLRTMHYQDGSPVPNITDRDTWYLSTVGAFCFYENDTLNKNVYGALYNWYVVADQRKICPIGWHVPSDDEWTLMENFLGGSKIAGMNIRETGLTHWLYPNAGATNLTGFTALPAGSRCYYMNDNFLGLEYYCMWWTSSQHNTFTESAWYRACITFESSLIRNYYLKRVGFSIRCLKD